MEYHTYEEWGLMARMVKRGERAKKYIAGKAYFEKAQTTIISTAQYIRILNRNQMNTRNWI